jgi:hypothetical protein
MNTHQNNNEGVEDSEKNAGFVDRFNYKAFHEPNHKKSSDNTIEQSIGFFKKSMPSEKRGK